MDKGKGCSTFLLIVFLVLVVIIIIYLVAPELIDPYLPQPGEKAWYDSIVNLLLPFTTALDNIAASIGEFFTSFQLR